MVSYVYKGKRTTLNPVFLFVVCRTRGHCSAPVGEAMKRSRNGEDSEESDGEEQSKKLLETKRSRTSPGGDTRPPPVTVSRSHSHGSLCD